MSSIRKTKKQVRYACGDVAAELLIAAHAIKDFNKEDAYKIIEDIASLQIDTLSKCKFAYDKVQADFEDKAAYRKARHQYYKAAFKKLNDEYAKHLQEIVDKMNATMPKSVKEAAKKA